MIRNSLLHKVTIRIFSAGTFVGVDFLAEPLSSVGARQHSPDFPDLPASLLASTSPQSLYPPSGHANMLRFFSARRKPLSAADRHNGKIFDRYGGFFLTAKFLSQEKKPSFESPFPYR